MSSEVITDNNELEKVFKMDNNKEKANTHLEKMGFKDNELFEQEHDNMLCDLMNDDIMLKILYMSQPQLPKLDYEYIKSLFKVECIKPEYPVKSHNEYIIGYIDILTEFSFDHKKFENRRIRLVIEIKTKIESIGALIRQINTYKEYLKAVSYTVIAPNTTEKQKDILLKSGIVLLDIKNVV